MAHNQSDFLKRKKLVAPSILSADFAKLGQEIKAIQAAGADWIHVDVMDGHFVPNLTIGAVVVKSLKPVAAIPLDVHLMIDEPEKYIQDFAKAGADYLTIHVESTKNPAQVLQDIRKLGMKPGITLRPGTAVETILPLLPLVDLALVMTVEPGFGGQSFMENQVAKISQLRKTIDDHKWNIFISVDGGVSNKTLSFLGDADVLVAGSYVFNQQDYKVAIDALKA